MAKQIPVPYRAIITTDALVCCLFWS